MIDRDLAEMYGVETEQLKGQLKLNINRFSKDFMFELTRKEFEKLEEPNWHLKLGCTTRADSRWKIFRNIYHDHPAL